MPPYLQLQYSTVQYSTVQCSTVQYSEVVTLYICVPICVGTFVPSDRMMHVATDFGQEQWEKRFDDTKQDFSSNKKICLMHSQFMFSARLG